MSLLIKNLSWLVYSCKRKKGRYHVRIDFYITLYPLYQLHLWTYLAASSPINFLTI